MTDEFMPPTVEVTGFPMTMPMRMFDHLYIIKADGSSVRFNEVVTGFIKKDDERIDQAVIRAAEEAVPDLQTVIYIPAKKPEGEGA